uniref:Retinol dehydrogenase 14b n=1 Tax=Eptatretus burgeri TaxID=7764 RepID=A0A8C4QDE2_EPTBU
MAQLLIWVSAGTAAVCLTRAFLSWIMGDRNPQQGVPGSERTMLGRTVLVTGANSGIGRATVVALARQGARVLLACRDKDAANQVIEEIRQDMPDAKLVFKHLDLASISSIRTFCDEVVHEEPRLDVLVNNAGVFRCPYAKTEEGFEMQFGVNHLGHFLLTNLLLDLLKRSAPSRVVVVSSKLYKRGRINFEDLNSERDYDPAFAYARSKLANLMFCRELSKRLEGTEVTVNALHPGMVRTNLGRHVNIPLLARPLFHLISWSLFRTPEEGARTVIYLASSPEVRGLSGLYFGDCKQEELLPIATDDAVARKLWEVSENVVGIGE